MCEFVMHNYIHNYKFIRWSVSGTRYIAIVLMAIYLVPFYTI